WILSGSEDKTVRVWRIGADEVSKWTCVSVVVGCSKGNTCLAWDPLVALEFVTGGKDGSVRVWRIANPDHTNGGSVSVQMLWGNDVGHLCASDLMFKDTIGLSLINRKLLVQRGAIQPQYSLASEREGTEGVEVE
ncbi:hypothetical protein BGZ95_002218, partial [Linnemannia exigua]